MIEGIKKMIYVVQLFLFCGLFTALVAVGTGGRAINEIYFYPKPVQERAVELGLTTYEIGSLLYAVIAAITAGLTVLIF